MGTPSDWVSGERVFAPPTGTLDVDWLVAAVVEAVPGTTPAEARAALVRAARRGDDQDGDQRGVGDGAGGVADPAAEPPDPVQAAAARVVDEARRAFRA